MIVTIDTAKDSADDIRKAIRMLASLVGDERESAKREDVPVAEGVFSMFDEKSEPAAATMVPQSTAPKKSINAMSDDDIPKIVPY